VKVNQYRDSLLVVIPLIAVQKILALKCLVWAGKKFAKTFCTFDH